MAPRSMPVPPESTAHDLRKNFKAEDGLAAEIAKYLAGEPAVWEPWFDGLTGAFKGGVASRNHKRMAAWLAWILGGQKTARAFLVESFKAELEGGLYGQSEPRSNKYAAWVVAIDAIGWQHAAKKGDAELADLALRSYRAWCIVASLGGRDRAIPSVTGNRWGGCYVSAVGVRSDLGHMEGDQRAALLTLELYPPGRKNSYRRNQEEARDAARKQGVLGDKVAEAERGKLLSQLWVLEGLEAAKRAGLAVDERLRSTLREYLSGGVSAARALPELLGPVGCRYAFHFRWWTDGTRVNSLEDSLGERCVFADAFQLVGDRAEFAFPYDGLAKNARGGSSEILNGEVVAQFRENRVSVQTPSGEPVSHLIWSGSGLREAA